jgi:hypothetical protein
MTELSPAAQAVLDAYMNNCGWLDGPLQKDYQCVAAVLRAAADQLGYGDGSGDPIINEHELLAIADELEAINEEDDFTIVAELEALPDD